jgi:hypothetical protein
LADDNKTPQEEATTPEPEFNAAAALQALESEESEESKAGTADEDKTEDKAEDDDKEEGQKDGDNAEPDDEDLDDLTAKLALDAAVADKLPDDVKTRYEQQVKGLAKRENQLSDREEALQVDEKGWQTYKGLETALFNATPQDAERALSELSKIVREHHKIEAKTEMKAEVKQAEEKDDGTILYDGLTFYSQTELKLYQDLQSANAKIDALEKGNQDPEIEEIKAERRANKEQAALNAWVDDNHKSIIGKVAAKAGGWGVTKEMVAEAAKADKAALEKDPVAVLKRLNPDAYAEWYAGLKNPKKPLKDMIDNSQAKGFTVPENPDEYSAVHALQEVGG